jgi:hypothetical protein
LLGVSIGAQILPYLFDKLTIYKPSTKFISAIREDEFPEDEFPAAGAFLFLTVKQWELRQAAHLAMRNWMKSQDACVQPVTATLPNKMRSMVGDSPHAARALMCSRIHADFFCICCDMSLFAKAASMEQLAEGPRRIGGVEYKAKTRLSELNPQPNFRPSNVRWCLYHQNICSVTV